MGSLFVPVARYACPETIKGKVRRMSTFENRFSQVGGEKGQREDAADIAFIETRFLCQGALIRRLATQQASNPKMGPSHGGNQ